MILLSAPMRAELLRLKALPSADIVNAKNMNFEAVNTLESSYDIHVLILSACAFWFSCIWLVQTFLS